MAGQIKNKIDEIIELRSGGVEANKGFVRALLIMKGIRPEDYTSMSPDDPIVIAKLDKMLQEFKAAA